MLQPLNTPTKVLGSKEGSQSKKPFPGYAVLEEKAFKDMLLGSRYHLHKVIGRGGMGTVFRATDLRTDGQVALKICINRAERKEIRHVLSEAAALAGISHQNIVSVKDYGMHKGIAFVVMELLEGKDLRQVMDEEMILSWPRIKDFTIQICDGLGELHSRGIIHGDIKPSNLFLTIDGVAKVLDFDTSQFTLLHEDDGLKETTGILIGTPSYTSPEQAKGRTDYDHRIDIYALGAVMYKMLCGERPFYGNPIEVLAKHINKTPERPSKRCPIIEIPEGADGIVMKALEKLPERRFSSAAEMRLAILKA